MSPRGLFGGVLLCGCAGEALVDEDVTFTDLGSFATNDEGVAAVRWEAPENVVSTEVFCGPYGFDTLATADGVSDPAGAAVYDGDAPFASGLRVGAVDDMLPILVPVSPTLPASAGVWTLDIFVDAAALPTTVTCGMVNRVGTIAADNTVDIAIVFVGVDGLSAGMNATSGAGDAGVQAALAALGELWAGLGLTLGDVRYDDFAGDVATYSSVDGYEEFGELLRSAADEPELTFFFVQDIDLGDGASILGMSGGAPGIAAHGGTSKSGVVINVANIVASPDQVARIMAHEGGHFLGLFHPTESDMSGQDPLDDTPVCATDTDDDGILTTTECADAGADNVMWPTALGGTATTFSADQAWVVARNPIALPG
ncbi:MAG: hypothetical protein EXR71_10135 [Myxococcales bacterium]|nr:hypothetical protein [Myxococcales bacterium]